MSVTLLLTITSFYRMTHSWRCRTVRHYFKQCVCIVGQKTGVASQFSHKLNNQINVTQALLAFLYLPVYLSVLVPTLNKTKKTYTKDTHTHSPRVVFLKLPWGPIGSKKGINLHRPICNLHKKSKYVSFGGVYLMNKYTTYNDETILIRWKKTLRIKGKRERLWYKKVKQKEKAHTCSENQKLTRSYTMYKYWSSWISID